MGYKKFSIGDTNKFSKEGHTLFNYPVKIENAEFLYIETEFGHECELLQKESTFNYYIIEGEGVYYLDDEHVSVSQGDFLSIEPRTRTWYQGNLKMLLLCSPPWKKENEVSFGVKNPHYLNK